MEKTRRRELSPWHSGQVSPEDLKLVNDATNAARASLEELAGEAGTTRHNLVAYRDGRARMPEEVRLRLSATLMTRARRLERLASALSESAGG